MRKFEARLLDEKYFHFLNLETFYLAQTDFLFLFDVKENIVRAISRPNTDFSQTE